MKIVIRNQIIDSINKKLPKLVERKIEVSDIPNKTYSIIGMRRTGKTYFLYQKLLECLNQGIDRSRLVYLNFEDERLIDLTIADMHWIVDEYYALYPENRRDQVYFFLDEIQMIPQWEKFVRRIMDSENAKIFISGSSAKMLSREIATSMRGRSIETIVYPFSFIEFLSCHNIDPPQSLVQIDKHYRSLLENQCNRYLSIGGFPEAQKIRDQDRQLLLQSYVNTVIFRDIVERYGITNIIVLKQLIKHLIRNFGAQFSVNKFFNYLKSNGIKVSKTTLHEYMSYIQDTFLIQNISIYAQSEKQRMVNPIKSYVIDMGLADAFLMSRESNIGHHLENCIFIELCRRNTRVSYFRSKSGYEVDFIVTYSDKTMDAIQVSADIRTKQTFERECRSLYEVKSMIKNIRLILITMSDEKEIKYKDNTIYVVPAWKWLLNLCEMEDDDR
jgi:hypothetical protein